MASTTETFLYLASLAQRVNELIVPALQVGKIVLADRYTMSVFSLAHYARRQPARLLREMIEFATQGLSPELTLLFDLEVPVAFARKALMEASTSRKEAEGETLYELLRRSYLREARLLKQKCSIVRSDQLPLPAMYESVEKVLSAQLKLRL